MNHNPVDLGTIPANALDAIDSSSYDKPYLFQNSDKTLTLKVAHTNSGSEHIPVHYFMPWGWDLDVPPLRQYNLYLQKNYHGDMYFYSLQHIGLTNIDPNKSVLEQLAHRWLLTQIDQGKIQPGKPVLIEGISLGGMVAAVIASIAHEYNITLGNLNIFEPAGMVKKSPLTMLRQVSRDTRQDYIDAFGGNLNMRRTKAKMIFAAIKNSSVQKRCIQEIAAGRLAEYVNGYLSTQKGDVLIGHGAESSFMPFAELDEFSTHLVDAGRVQSFDFVGVPHGFSGKALELADWYSKETATRQ